MGSLHIDVWRAKVLNILRRTFMVLLLPNWYTMVQEVSLLERNVGKQLFYNGFKVTGYSMHERSNFKNTIPLVPISLLSPNVLFRTSACCLGLRDHQIEHVWNIVGSVIQFQHWPLLIWLRKCGKELHPKRWHTMTKMYDRMHKH